MSSTTPTDKSDSAHRPRYIILGTDTDGADHVLRTVDDTVFVIDTTGRREARDSLAGCSWQAYRSYVAHRRGWREWRPRVPARIPDPYIGLRGEH
jgi:hypothetical protein